MIENSLEQNEIIIKELDANDDVSVEEFVALERLIWGQGLDFTADDIKKEILRGEVIYVIYNGKQMVGTTSVLVQADLENPRKVIKYLPPESLYASSVGIDPAFRGNRLQGLLLEKCIELARKLNKETILGAVRPENGASVRNITNIGGKILAYSRDFHPDSDNPSRLVGEVDLFLQKEAWEPIDKVDALMPDEALDSLSREEDRIIVLIQSGDNIDSKAQKVIEKILSNDYIGTGVQTLFLDSNSIQFNGMAFRELSSFPAEAEKRLRERKEKIQKILLKEKS